jgi:hypothetical protein
VDPVQDISGEIASGDTERVAASQDSLIEKWLHHHVNGIALAVVVAGLGLRVFIASRSYLNPDEALHYVLINQRSAFDAYEAGRLTSAHPPLFYLILYFWHFLGQSELMLRMPSVIMGAAFCWVAFKWMGTVLSKPASLMGIIFCAFSPAMLALSTEVRGYTLMLLCMASALYFLARAFEGKSSSRMWCFSISLYFAILSHYSVLFFTLGVGLTVLARIADSHLPRKVVITWFVGQFGALALCAFLYLTQVSKVKNSMDMWAMPYDTAYFHAERENIFEFTIRNTLKIFMYLFGQPYAARILFLCFIAGFAILFGRDLLSRREGSPSTRLGILLLFPFVAVWGAGIAGFYPYAGTRHTVFLAPLVIAGASYLLAAISGQRLWAGLLIASVLMALSNTSKLPAEPTVSESHDSPAVMTSAIRYMEQTIPRGDLILVDYQSSLPLIYYFCGPKKIIPPETFRGEYFEFACNGNPVISFRSWKTIAQVFPVQFEGMARAQSLKPGDRVWFYQTGWEKNLDADLDRHEPRFRCLAPRDFGTSITVIPFVVGSDFLPVTPPGNCSN